MPGLSLKSLPAFESLTAAEAAVFERDLEERVYLPGEPIDTTEELFIVSQGSLGIAVQTQGRKREVGTVPAGDLVGELAFFEPEPVPILAQADGEARCYGVDRQVLKRGFRYSRTGAMKFMGIFARSLSRKIRSANETLNQLLAQGVLPASGRPFGPTHLEAIDLQRLRGFSVSRSFPAEEAIFREGRPGTELFVIAEGEVEIVKEVSAGAPLSLARLGPGDFFGEMAFVDGRPRSATAIARTPLEVLVLTTAALERVTEFNLGTGLYLTNVICKILARRLNSTLQRIGAG